jgi:hypothetical protein
MLYCYLNWEPVLSSREDRIKAQVFAGGVTQTEFLGHLCEQRLFDLRWEAVACQRARKYERARTAPPALVPRFFYGKASSDIVVRRNKGMTKFISRSFALDIQS